MMTLNEELLVAIIVVIVAVFGYVVKRMSGENPSPKSVIGSTAKLIKIAGKQYITGLKADSEADLLAAIEKTNERIKAATVPSIREAESDIDTVTSRNEL